MTEKAKSRSKTKTRGKIQRPDPLFLSEEVPVLRNEQNITRKPSNLTMQIIASPLTSPTTTGRSSGIGAAFKLDACQEASEEDNCRRLLYQMIRDSKESEVENSSNWLLYQTIMLLVCNDGDVDAPEARTPYKGSRPNPPGEDGTPRAAWLTPSVRAELAAQCVERLNLSLNPIDSPAQTPLKLDMYGVDDDGEVMDDFPAIEPTVDLRSVGMRRFLLRRRSDQLPFLFFRLAPAAPGCDTCTSPVDKAIEYINHLNQQLKDQCGPGGALGNGGYGVSFDDDEFYSLSPGGGLDRAGSSSSFTSSSTGRHTFSVSPNCSASPFAGIGLGSPELQMMPTHPVPMATRWRSLSSSNAVPGKMTDAAAPVRVSAVPATEGNTRVPSPTRLPKPPVFQFCVCTNNQFFNDERTTWHNVLVDPDGDRRRHALTHAKYGTPVTCSSSTSPCACADSDSDGSSTSSSAGCGSVLTYNSSLETTDACEFDRACMDSAGMALAGVGIAGNGSHRPAGDGDSSGGESPDRGTWHDIGSPGTSQRIADVDSTRPADSDGIAGSGADWLEFENIRRPPAPLTPPPSEPLSMFASFKRMFL
jgi:hypothetical protein